MEDVADNCKQAGLNNETDMKYEAERGVGAGGVEAAVPQQTATLADGEWSPERGRTSSGIKPAAPCVLWMESKRHAHQSSPAELND